MMRFIHEWVVTRSSSSKYLVATLFFPLLFACHLRADTITFSDPLRLFPTGKISYGGGSDPLVGTKIQISDVVGPDGVDHAVHLFDGIDTGLLSFQTGDFVGTGMNGDLIFTGSGSSDFIKIVGTVPDAGVLGSPPPVLLSGTFLGAVVDPQLGTIKLGLEIGSGFDQKNPQLLDFFGIPEGSEFFFTSTLLTPVIDIQSDGSFNSKVLSTTVTNTAVPETSSAVLGLTALGLIAGFRKLAKARFTLG